MDMEEYDGYRFVFVDIDNTLLTSDKKVSDRTLYIFSKLKELGVEVVLCSGRQRSNCEVMSKIVNGSKYIISANGADVFDRQSRKKIYADNIDRSALKKIADIVKKYNIKARFVCEDTGYITKDFSNPADETLLNEDLYSFVATHDIPQVVLYTENLSDFAKIKSEISFVQDIKVINQNKQMENQQRYFLDVTSKKTSKGNGIKNLLKSLEIPKFFAIAIGDDDNDVSMFENVGVAIAMANSSKKCMSKATIITDSNDEDGIYNALINLFDVEEY